jgi:hypothetical protein
LKILNEELCILRIICDIIKVFYTPTDTQVKCLKNTIKIDIKTAPTCLGAITPSSGSALFLLGEVTVVKTVD